MQRPKFSWWKWQALVYIREKWPLMTKKEHKKVLDIQVSSVRRETKAEIVSERAHLQHVLYNIVPKLTRMSIDRSPVDSRYRFILELDPYHIQEAFEWGNDHRGLEYYAQAIGHRAFREMMSLNTRRGR